MTNIANSDFREVLDQESMERNNLVKKSVLLIFDSTHLTMKAEEIIKKSKISNMIVPKPKGIESRCGVALKVYESDISKITSLLKKHNIPEFKVISN